MKDLREKIEEIIFAEVFDQGTYEIEGLDPESVKEATDQLIQLIQQEVRGAIDNFADHLYVNKILLDFMNKDDIVVDFLSNYKVEDRLDQLRKGKG